MEALEGGRDDHHDLQTKQPLDCSPLADPGERRAIFNVLDSYR